MKKMSLITDRINEQLNYLGFSRADMCRFTGISESTIRNWIRGTSPQAEMLFKVARFLNVSLEYLITGKNPPPKSEKEEKNYDSEFLDLFNSLPECEQTEIKEIVKLKCRKCAVSQTRKQHEKKDLLDFQFD